MNLIVFFVFSMFILILLFILNNKILLRPEILYVAGFIPASFLALFYVKKWNLNLANQTLGVLIGGAALFGITSIFTYMLLSLKKPRAYKIYSVSDDFKVPYVEKWKLVFFILFQILVLLWIIRALLRVGNTSQLSQAIYYYRYTTTFTDETIQLPTLLVYSRVFCIAAGYVWVYLLILGILNKNRKNFLLLIINLVFCCIINMMFGSRTGIIQLFFAAMIQYYMILGKRSGWKNKFEIKNVVYVLILVLAMIASFQMLGGMIGRSSTTDFNDYIAKYLSAEIKNLDIYIRKHNFGSRIEENQTFIYAINYLSGKFGKPLWRHQLDLPFLHINGFNLGNVYTAYYAYLYDFGYIGVVFCTMLMSAISQILFYKAAYKKEKIISIYIILYSYIAFAVLFSFFSNKFYEMVFNMNFIRFIVFWWITKIFLFDVQFDFRNFKIHIKCKWLKSY